MKRSRKAVFIFIYAVLGFVLALQFKSTMLANKKQENSSLNTEGLLAQLESEKKIQEDLHDEIKNNRALKDEYLASYIELNENEELRQVWQDLNFIRLYAGLSDVYGPGITIKLDDADARKPADANLLIIHDSDIRIILNELKKAGAQAISINGERIVATSEQLCAGPTIRINKEVYTVPYVINAIGDPDTLFHSLVMSERVILMRKHGIKVSVTRSGRVLVNRYKKDISALISGLEVAEK